jgi:hypothetical protein
MLEGRTHEARTHQELRDGVDRHHGFFCCSILALRRLFKRE